MRVLEFLGRRSVLLGLMSGYLAISIISHHVPLTLGWDAPLGIGAWLLAASQILRGLLIHWEVAEATPRVDLWASLWRLLPAWLLFASVAAAVWVSSSYGNVPPVCAEHPVSCAGRSNYSSADGVYARQYPVDAEGNTDRTQPWVTISEETYVAEVGTLLRETIRAAAWAISGSFVTAEAIRLGRWRRNRLEW